jgi:hypothetical protein
MWEWKYLLNTLTPQHPPQLSPCQLFPRHYDSQKGCWRSQTAGLPSRLKEVEETAREPKPTGVVNNAVRPRRCDSQREGERTSVNEPDRRGQHFRLWRCGSQREAVDEVYVSYYRPPKRRVVFLGGGASLFWGSNLRNNL